MKVEDQLSQNLPFQGRLTLKQVKDQPFQGRLAQLVQSVCLTSRGSGVRIPQRPHRILCSSLVSFGRQNGFFKSKKLAIFSRRLSTVKWLSLLVCKGLSFWSPPLLVLYAIVCLRVLQGSDKGITSVRSA